MKIFNSLIRADLGTNTQVFDLTPKPYPSGDPLAAKPVQENNSAEAREFAEQLQALQQGKPA